MPEGKCSSAMHLTADIVVLTDVSDESDDDVAFIGEARSTAIEILDDGNSSDGGALFGMGLNSAIPVSSDPPDMDIYVRPPSRPPSLSPSRSPRLKKRSKTRSRSRTVTPGLPSLPSLSPEELFIGGRNRLGAATWVGAETPRPELRVTRSLSSTTGAPSGSKDAPPRRTLQDILNDRSYLGLPQLSPPPEEAQKAAAVEVEPVEVARGRKRKSDAENVEPAATSDEDGLSSEQLAQQREQAKRKADKEEQKQADKDARKLARDTAKAAKEAEKSYQKKVAEVNRLRTTKIDALQDLEIHMAHDLSLPTSPIAGALPELRARLDESKSSLHFLSEDDTIVNGSIQFRRQVRATWNPVIKRYVPLDEARQEWEKTTVLVASADDIVDRVSHGDDALITWLADVRLTLGMSLNDHLLLLVRGMDKYHSRTQSIINRNFRETARAGLSGEQVAAAKSSSVTGRLDKAEVEEELLRAQVVQRIFVVQVEKTEDVEDWLFNLAGDVAIRPYKLLSKSHLPFSAPPGVHKAVVPDEVLALMLQEVQGLTQSAASGITEQHGSFREFMAAYEKAEARGDGRAEDMLAECQVRSRKNGVPTQRRVGNALSRKVYGIMRGDDPLSLS